MVQTGKIRRPASGRTALLVIDMINDLDFPEAEAMTERVLEAARRIGGLCRACHQADVPVVFVNDNFGQWHSERCRLIAHCRKASEASAALVEMLSPEEDDYFVIKPMHSGFYATNLPVLLPKLGVSRVILTGVAADICVLFTAADAHMRDYAIWTPRDCVAAAAPERADWALDIMRQAMGAETAPTADLCLEDWLAQADA